jgi:predicted RNase H-like nuclease
LSLPVTIVGVDGCPAGWYAVQVPLRGHAIVGRVHERFGDLLEALPAESCVAVDIPIGLSEHGERACDQAARQLLGPRASSVFPAPLRGVLGARDHAQASALRRAIEGKGMSIQAWNIVRKVVEVDVALRGSAAWATRVQEVHPEVCFLQMNGGQPLAHGKKSAAGRALRMALLQPHFPGAAERLLDEHPRRAVQADDVLDALACLWTAQRLVRGQALRLPAMPTHDAFGLRMAIHA